MGILTRCNCTYHNTAQGALFLALVGCQFGGVVCVSMSTAAELSGFLLPLLDLLHMPTAALIVLWKKPETRGHMGNREFQYGVWWRRKVARYKLTFIWIFFCSSSMASCWAALRAARRSSRSLQTGHRRAVWINSRLCIHSSILKGFGSTYLALSRAASSLAFSFSCLCCSIRASCSFLRISSSSTRACRSASRTRLRSYRLKIQCFTLQEKKKVYQALFFCCCCTCTASSLACFSSCLLCLSSCSSLRRCSYSFNLARASCLLFWASRVLMNAISFTCTDTYTYKREHAQSI